MEDEKIDGPYGKGRMRRWMEGKEEREGGEKREGGGWKGWERMKEEEDGRDGRR